MEQLRRIYDNLSARQRLAIVLCAVLAAAGLMAFTEWRHTASLRPLYTGLSAEDAGPVVQALKERGVEYRLSDDGGVVMVPAEKVAELRLQMASVGLPRSGRAGFELFDKTNFGATDFTEKINYRRALEGELERSVRSLSEVEEARVHVTFPKESVFTENRQPAKASVLVRLRPGMQLPPQAILGVRYLLSSAVEGLAPESVSVLDMRGNLLGKARRSGGEDDLSDSTTEYRQRTERDLLAKIQSTLEPLLGAERYRASVSVDCDFSSAEVSEETYDPTRSVMVSSQKTEDSTPGVSAGGIPGTASSLPQPAPRPLVSAAGMSRKTENITYQSSRTVRHTRLPQGGVKRISVGILVDQDIRWERAGKGWNRVLVPPSPEALKSIRDVVAAAVSFSDQRGDQIVIESLPFEATLRAEPPAQPVSSAPTSAAPDLPAWARDPRILAAAGGALVLLLLAASVLLMVRRKKHRGRPEPAASAALPSPSPSEAKPALPGGPSSLELAAGAAQRALADAQRDRQLAASVNAVTDSYREHVAENAKKDPTATAQVLRSWLLEGSNS